MAKTTEGKENENECKRRLSMLEEQLNNKTLDQIVRTSFPLHKRFLDQCFHPLSEDYMPLEASRSWIGYWAALGMGLLGETTAYHQKEGIRFAQRLKQKGGFGGSVGQICHIASIFSVIGMLINLKIPANVITLLLDRHEIYNTLLSLKTEEGCFRIHKNGETDLRTIYMALCIASLLKIMTPGLTLGIPEYILRCQTFDGGIAMEPELESHAGSVYCGLATMNILNRLENLKISDIEAWLVHRQTSVGGFQGRPGKLVDSCYGFWVGGSLKILQEYLGRRAPSFDKMALMKFLVGCCMSNNGGFRDKPKLRPDFYHTAYSLCTLSIITESSEMLCKLEELDVTYGITKKALKYWRSQTECWSG